MIYSCASFFAGVGGIDIGFTETKKFKVVYANEIDENAVKTYEKNFNLKVDKRDIKKVKPTEVPKFDVLLAGFPCQAFSVAGRRQGFNDEKGRGTLFFELIKFIKAKKPKVIFLENVKNLVSHDNGNTFRVIYELLRDCDYEIKYAVLNAKEYGNIPQNRERIYIVAFKNRSCSQRFEFPTPIPLTKTINDLLTKKKVDDKYYYKKGSCYFYNKLVSNVKSDNTIYQWRRKYVRENKSNVCPTLTANMGMGGHNVPIVKTKYGFRKLTPHECFNFQGFPNSFKLPNDMVQTHLYKQAGNSVVVSVISRIAINIFNVLNK